MTGLIDTHAHLHDRAFGSDLTATLSRARAAGVGTIVTIGTDVPESEAAVHVAQQETDVYAVVGVHPHDAESWNAATQDRIMALASRGRVVAIGEIGLDFYRNLSPREDQERAFRAQLDLASALQLPVVIHSRDAHDATYAILKSWAWRTTSGDPIGGIHCFSGDAELAQKYTNLGFVISFAGPVTYPSNEALRAAAAVLPSERVAVETDCPYLTPPGTRGQRNEPSFVTETAACVAAARGEDLARFTETSTAAARRLFRLSPTPTIAP